MHSSIILIQSFLTLELEMSKHFSFIILGSSIKKFSLVILFIRMLFTLILSFSYRRSLRYLGSSAFRLYIYHPGPNPFSKQTPGSHNSVSFLIHTSITLPNVLCYPSTLCNSLKETESSDTFTLQNRKSHRENYKQRNRIFSQGSARKKFQAYANCSRKMKQTANVT